MAWPERVDTPPASGGAPFQARTPVTPAFLPLPATGSPQLTVWCTTDKPTGIGFDGLLHYQSLECLASEIGVLEINHSAAN